MNTLKLRKLIPAAPRGYLGPALSADWGFRALPGLLLSAPRRGQWRFYLSSYLEAIVNPGPEDLDMREEDLDGLSRLVLDLYRDHLADGCFATRREALDQLTLQMALREERTCD